MIKFIYKEDIYNNGFRVWLSAWAGDVFEILTKQQFAELSLVCKRFNLKIEEAPED